MELAKLRKGTVEWYEEAYRIMRFDHGYEGRIEAVAKKVLSGRDRYQKFLHSYGLIIPWRVIACIHLMEASCDWRATLHNGERIIGTGRKTRLVPEGFGPFATWEEGAISAVRHMRLDRTKQWTLGLELQMAEIFNGLGYLKHHSSENSPYIWGCTSLNDGTGKYVADGHYDPNANANAQVGVAAVYKQLDQWGMS